MTQNHLKKEEIQTFFSDIQSLPASKYLIQLEKGNLSIGERVWLRLTTNCSWPRKNRYHWLNWCWKINSVSQVTNNFLMIKRGFHLVLCHKITTKTAIGFISSSLSQQNWEKEELQKIQSHLASLNFSYPEMQHQIRSLSGGQQGKLLLWI